MKRVSHRRVAIRGDLLVSHAYDGAGRGPTSRNTGHDSIKQLETHRHLVLQLRVSLSENLILRGLMPASCLSKRTVVR